MKTVFIERGFTSEGQESACSTGKEALHRSLAISAKDKLFLERSAVQLASWLHTYLVEVGYVIILTYILVTIVVFMGCGFTSRG